MDQPGAGVVPLNPAIPIPETKRLAVLGSTGSIGRQAIEVAREEGYQIASLAAGQNTELLANQIESLRPEFVSVGDEEAKARLLSRLKTKGLESLPVIDAGRRGAVRAAAWPGVDTVLAAITGFAGLEPVLAAVSSGRKIALANKESLVVAGHEVMGRALESGALILPVDSEHSAVWQCLLASPGALVRRIILTCSGGPFHGRSRESLVGVSAGEALAHPTWSMGAKISLDSATLMNKAFEVIEACHLFGLPHREIEVVVHPQSLVHSLVEFSDGALLAQLGEPDMAIPIRFALTFPNRSTRVSRPSFDFFSPGHNRWTFEPVGEELFPAIAMAREAFDKGGLMPLVLNAANEAAVARFLAGEIGFVSIFTLVRRALDDFSHWSAIRAPSFDDMMGAHRRVVETVSSADVFGNR